MAMMHGGNTAAVACGDALWQRRALSIPTALRLRSLLEDTWVSSAMEDGWVPSALEEGSALRTPTVLRVRSGLEDGWVSSAMEDGWAAMEDG